MFAGDTKLYIPSSQNPQDHLLLQQSLENLVDWYDKWQMWISPMYNIYRVANSSVL